ncbi:MAG: hypothetical protein IT383_14775 [Deltaproteobacteria bacterium]|nr:hypothetical protein [Deltaproteobacteria bacterium]
MDPALAALLASLIVVALVHTKSRIAGAIAATLWCVGACAYGVIAFRTHGPLVFVGIGAPAWVYFAFLGGLFAFNAGVVLKALRRRRREGRGGTGPAPGDA